MPRIRVVTSFEPVPELDHLDREAGIAERTFRVLENGSPVGSIRTILNEKTLRIEFISSPGVAVDDQGHFVRELTRQLHADFTLHKVEKLYPHSEN
jgi:hypothetical protein